MIEVEAAEKYNEEVLAIQFKVGSIFKMNKGMECTNNQNPVHLLKRNNEVHLPKIRLPTFDVLEWKTNDNQLHRIINPTEESNDDITDVLGLTRNIKDDTIGCT